MIVKARGDILTKSISLGKQYETKFSKHVKVNLDHAIPQYVKFVESGIGEVFALVKDNEPVGAIAGIIYPDLNSGIRTAVECFWFVNEEHRGQGLLLLAAFESWAVEKGCCKIALIHLVDSFPSALEKVYTRKGYELVEKHYVKEIQS